VPRIEVHDVQADFIECRDRYTAYIGGIGSGKTYAGALKAMSQAKRNTTGLVVAPTYPMLRDATLRTFLDLAGDAASLNRSEMRVALANGAEILFRSADNPDRLRGPNIHWAWIDEGAMCDALAWDIVIGRLRADGTAGPCWVTSTPRGRNWLYHRLDQMTVFKSRTRDNPYLSPEFIASLTDTYAGLFAAQELDAEFVSFEGLVYEMFDRNLHRQERDGTEIQRWLLGVDEGFTNPAVLLAVGVDGDGRLHIGEEWYERQRLQEDHVAAAKEMHDRYHFESVYVDRSAPGLIAALHKAGLPTREHGARVLEGIREVQNYLAVADDGRPRLTVSPACANTINEFESYVWAERGKAGDKRQVDEPEKVNDHAMDALRYVVCALRKPRYVEINVGKPAFQGGR
jgi:PBSX family phage terminase large subunit